MSSQVATWRPRSAVVIAAVSWTCLVGCSERDVTVEYRHGYAFSEAERRAIESVAALAVRDVRLQLPSLPNDLLLTVQAGGRVVPETGDTGEVGRPDRVYWTVDPNHAGGVLAVVSAQLRATLFHELYHLVRETQLVSASLTDSAVNEGLATAFEREFGGAATPWGAYPENVTDWVREFLALPVDASRDHWMLRHPDGRRWIGYKVGTYLADRAALTSGHSLAELATVPTEEIIAWAGPQ